MNTPLILDGKTLAKSIIKLAVRVRIKDKSGVTPILATIIWGTGISDIYKDEGQYMCQIDAVAQGRNAGRSTTQQVIDKIGN